MSRHDPPTCATCHFALRRVDHVGTEHLILDESLYRTVNATEGLASEVDLICGHCQTPLTKQAKAFFYRRWVAVRGVN